MYKINGRGIVWDAKNNKPLIRFEKGVAETDSEEIAKKLEELGYQVEEIEAEGVSDITKMNVKELKKYAEENGVALGDASSKQDILICIQTTQQSE